MYSVEASLFSFCNCTLVSGSGITFAYLFFTSAPGGNSSIFPETWGIPANSSLIALTSLQKDESPAKFRGWEGMALWNKEISFVEILLAPPRKKRSHLSLLWSNAMRGEITQYRSWKNIYGSFYFSIQSKFNWMGKYLRQTLWGNFNKLW